MDAVTYVKEYRRLCNEHSACIGCPLNKFESCVDADPKEMVKVVEKWSKEHPLVTNGDVLKEMLPDGSTVNDQYNPMAEHIFIEVPKNWWKAEYKGV